MRPRHTQDDMTTDIQLRGLESEGIFLISPSAPEFDSLVQSLFKGSADLLLKLKPFMTIVSNHSDRTIVAFTLKWTTGHGRHITFSQRKYPDAVTGLVVARDNEILPGEQRIVPKGIEIHSGLGFGQATEDFYLDQFVNMFAAESKATLRIEVDAAILNDGTLLGPDESDLATHFAVYFKAKQDLYLSIIDLLDKGSSLKEAFRPLNSALAKKFALEDHRNGFSIYPVLAAQDTGRWRQRYGDAPISLMRQAITKEPFAVMRTVGAQPPELEGQQVTIRCPKCNWLPRTEHRWSCKCGHHWNTFSTGGLCPACNYQWTITGCLRCGQISPHSEWYTQV
jgi:hypothetical protein